MVRPGECFGLIGLNGAGKSTTFRLVTGALRPTNGRVSLHCSRIGFCPQNNSIDPHITVFNQLRVGSSLDAQYKCTHAIDGVLTCNISRSTR